MTYYPPHLHYKTLGLDCWCHKCTPKGLSPFDPRSSTGFMRLCPECGNKRCPKATDHNLACTNSNEPRQEGSRY